MNKRDKRVTYTRADRVLLACVSLMECGDFGEYDPDGTARQALDRAADVAREIRDNARIRPLWLTSR
jgi:hypothetical protein